MQNFLHASQMLKKNPNTLIQIAEGSPITILNHNKPTTYRVSTAAYEALSERIENHEFEEKAADVNVS